MRSPRFVRALVLGTIFASGSAIEGCKKPADAPVVVDAAPLVLAPETPIAAPDGLVVEGTIRSFDALLSVGRAVMPLVDDKANRILSDFLAIDRTVADELETAKPAHVAFTVAGSDFGFALAVPLRDAAKAIAQLKSSGLQASEDPALELWTFVAKPEAAAPGKPRRQVLGVRRGFLVAASNDVALRSLSPYLTRTMPTKGLAAKADQLVALSVPQRAVRTVVREGASAYLATAAAQRNADHEKVAAALKAGFKGAPAGLGDALGEYGAQASARAVEWLADAGDLSIVLSSTKPGFRLRVDLASPTPDSPLGRHLAAMRVGDVNAVLALPPSSVLAAIARGSKAYREEASADLVKVLAGLFSREIDDKARAAIEAFLVKWDAARTDDASAALLYEGTEVFGVVAGLGSSDPALSASLLRDALKAVFAVHGVAEGLEKEGIGAPVFTTEKLGDIDATVLTIRMPDPARRDPKTEKSDPTPKKPKPSDNAELVFGVSPTPGKPELLLAVGVGGRALFSRMIEARKGTALGASPDLASFVGTLGAEVSVGVVAMPSRIVPMTSGAHLDAPPAANDGMALTFGREPTGAFLTFDTTRAGMSAVMAIGKGLGPRR